jgi:8-amino-7-oxononanoate synthase
MNTEYRLREELASLEAKSRLRSLRRSSGIDFTSNDYLGLTDHPLIRKAVIEMLENGTALGAGGSRLLRGNHDLHEQFESQFADFQKREKALYFSSGYAANHSVLTAIPRKGDLILYDEMVHASIREGVKASQAESRSTAHNSLDDLQTSLQIAHRGDVYIVVESIYSMDGDEAPLKGLAELARRYNAKLIVDEAHSTGLYGETGAGLIEEYNIRDDVFISVHPCGKALGAAGCVVCADEVVIDYLINRARMMIFTTALPPVIAFQLMQAVNSITSSPELRKKVHQNTAAVREQLAGKIKWKMLSGSSPIIIIIIGSDNEAVNVADELQSRGLDVRAIRPPTVADGQARLRITIHADHQPEQLKKLTDALIELGSV